MKIATLTDLFARELVHLRSAEGQLMEALPRVIRGANRVELREALGGRLGEAGVRMTRLDLLIGECPRVERKERCEAMAGLILEADEVLEEEGEEMLRDLGLIAVCRRIGQHGMAGYGCARTYATHLAFGKAIDLLTETLEEEGATDGVLTTMASEVLVELAAENSRMAQSL